MVTQAISELLLQATPLPVSAGRATAPFQEWEKYVDAYEYHGPQASNKRCRIGNRYPLPGLGTERAGEGTQPAAGDDVIPCIVMIFLTLRSKP